MTATSPIRPDPPEQPRQGLTFVLVHGAFLTGVAWEYVAAELRRRGHAVHTPTIAGHGPDAPKHLTHADAVASLVVSVSSWGAEVPGKATGPIAALHRLEELLDDTADLSVAHLRPGHFMRS